MINVKLTVYKILLWLTAKANNGELLNKHTSRDSKDALTVFFWRLAKKVQHESCSMFPAYCPCTTPCKRWGELNNFPKSELK